MNILTLIFGDRFAQRVGENLLKHFESGEYPEELLQYPDINVLYREYNLKKAERGRGPADMETVEYLEALVALRRSEQESESKKSDQ